MSTHILVMNAGSSSQKSSLYVLPDPPLPEVAPEPLWQALVDWTHHQGFAEITIQTAQAKHQQEMPSQSRAEAIAYLLHSLGHGSTQVLDDLGQIAAVGHRVVHGGSRFCQSVRVTPEVKAEIGQLASFAPLHNPANLQGIEAIEQALGLDLLQVAVFDTAFHRQMPEVAQVYPGPYAWYQQGILRYGFHGTSHQYCARRAAQLLGRDLASLKLITCHLGNGCSLAAVRDGHSIDTTMGFTPLDGLMMGTRSGAVDPGILLHLLREMDVAALDAMLNKGSGLLGISGVSADLRQVMAAIDRGDDRAKLALDLFVYRLQKEMGAMLVALGGCDALVFMGGIGENSAPVRQRACQAFGFLGVILDPDRNGIRSSEDRNIARADSALPVLVIRTQEDWAIALECQALL